MKIPEVPANLDVATRRCLTEMRKATLTLLGAYDSFQSFPVQGGTIWGTLSPDTKPTTLGPQDVGKLFYAVDFDRTFRWTGYAWVNAPGEDPQCEIRFFSGDQDPGLGWHLCNGATITRSKNDGTTINVTVPDYTTSAYIKAGIAASIGPNAAAGASSSDSAGTPAGTISTPTFTGSALGTHAHELPFVFSGSNLILCTSFSTGANRTMVTTFLGAGTSGSLAVEKSNTISAGTPAGTISTPTFTGSALGGHSHSANTLELRNSVLKAYYRL